MKIIAIIPARYASTRFPGKPLVQIQGKSMIRRVYEQVKQCTQISEAFVATDDERIASEVNSFGGKVIMTGDHHLSGTDRCFEAYTKSNTEATFVINIQGDEPFIKPEQINELIHVLDEKVELATLVKKIEDDHTLFNVNTPKVIFNKNNEAIYFSRNTIPFVRSADKDLWKNKHTFYKHIGIYAYRTDVLKAITSLAPSSLELAESLEQLRWLENGYRIKVAETLYESIGIDTPEDLEKIKESTR